MKKHIFKEGNFSFSKGEPTVLYFQCIHCKKTIQSDLNIKLLDKKNSKCSKSPVNSTLPELISGMYDCTIINNKFDLFKIRVHQTLNIIKGKCKRIKVYIKRLYIKIFFFLLYIKSFLS